MSASDLHSKTLPQLRALAKARGLEGITGLKKADLVARLLEAGVDAPAPGPVAPAEPARSEMPVSAPEAARPEAAAPAESTAPRRRGRSGRQGAPTGVRHDAEERDVEASRDLEPEPEPEQQHEPQGSIASTAPMPTAAPPAPTGFVVPSAPVTFGTPDPAESVPVPPMGAEVELPGVTMRDKPDRPDAAEEEPPRHTETVDRDRHEPRYEYTRGRLSGRSRRGDRGGNGDSRHEAPRVDGRPDQRSGQRHDGRGDGRPQQDARPDRRGRGDSRDMREPRDGRGEAEGDARHLVTGILEILPEGRGFLRRAGYLPANDDVYVSESQIRRFGLRTGDTVVGEARPPRDGTSERYYSLLRIESVNSAEPESCRNRPDFEDLTPIFPTERFVLETDRNRLSNRLIDIISPIGKGQRGLIVAPPKAGKTTILKDIAHALITNNPEVVLLVLLVDERPEEVTDISRAVGSGGEVIASTFDQLPENHMRAADFCLERAKRLVEHGRDVTILLDSLTRLARASNLTVVPSGRTLSGGLDPAALYKPKRFLGAARKAEEAGSLTIMATVLIETGSRMDEMIYEEFKATGNSEITLDRSLAERRIFPAIDIRRTSTRHHEALYSPEELKQTTLLTRALASLEGEEATRTLIRGLKQTQSNKQFLSVAEELFRREAANLS